MNKESKIGNFARAGLAGLVLASPFLGVEKTSAETSASGEPGFTASRYGERFNGGNMKCGGKYWSSDESILAVPYALDKELPCGTPVRIINPANEEYIDAVRTDTCGGCSPNRIDLSEAGIARLCGGPCDIVFGLVITRNDQ